MTDLLRVTTLDEAFINLGAKAEMGIQFEVRVQGRLDADRLASALRRAVARHPLARARLAPAPIGALRMDWHVPDAADHLGLEITDEPISVVRSRLHSRAPQLSVSPSFQATLVRDDGGDFLMLNLNHATFDGVSAVRLMTSIARAYAGEDDPIGGPPIEEARDLKAMAGSRNIKDVLPRATKIGKDILDRKRVTRVAADGADPDGTTYGFTPLRLDATETLTVLGLKPQGATLNDLAMAALVLSILRWNREHHAPIGDSVSIMMPVNMRPMEWQSEVVSNFASYLAIVLPTNIVDDITEAAGVAGTHTRPLKEIGAAGWLVDLLEGGTWIPAVLKKQLQHLLPLVQNQFIESATLSYLGKVAIPAFGDAGEVTEVWFSPPCLSEQLIPMAVGLAGVGNELFLSIRTNRRHLGDTAAERFARILRQVLTATW
jgi:NRPS condensation-like uncharacterized protein